MNMTSPQPFSRNDQRLSPIENFFQTTEKVENMYQTSHATITPSINTVWLSFDGKTNEGILRCHLLGLASDHALVCGLPNPQHWGKLEQGLLCRGHTIIDGETYQFETTVREVLPQQPALILNPPHKITKRPPRHHPRVPVEIPGTVRPTAQDGHVLAVLPAMMSDLCPTGCQLVVSETTWPSLATLSVMISCRLPGLTHTSKFQGRVEWLEPTPELHMGIQFQFSSLSDVACKDLEKWFRSQRAKLINTVA